MVRTKGSEVDGNCKCDITESKEGGGRACKERVDPHVETPRLKSCKGRMMHARKQCNGFTTSDNNRGRKREGRTEKEETRSSPGTQHDYCPANGANAPWPKRPCRAESAASGSLQTAGTEEITPHSILRANSLLGFPVVGYRLGYSTAVASGEGCYEVTSPVLLASWVQFVSTLQIQRLQGPSQTPRF